MIVTETTKDIQITVKATFKEDFSRPAENNFLFVYSVTIENKSKYTVQLLRRHWSIFDSSGEYREVEGDGVVGQQPVLQPGDIYEYESACNLQTDIGSMKGNYIMERQADKLQFMVNVPEFEMVVPARLN
jgi:ApaG protein